MIIYPAIDLKDGKCVRLYKGDTDQATSIPVIASGGGSSQGLKLVRDAAPENTNFL